MLWGCLPSCGSVEKKYIYFQLTVKTSFLPHLHCRWLFHHTLSHPLAPCFEPQLAHIFIIKINLSLCPPSCASHPDSHYESRQVHVFKITKNMSFFPPQAFCLFPPITSASLKYFLEGSRVAAELKVPQPSDFSCSVFRAPHDQHCPATLGNNARRLCHTCLRQPSTQGQGKLDGDSKTRGVKALLNSVTPQGLHCRAELADKQALQKHSQLEH